jgi:arylsulfatase A-like enzyme
VWHRLGLALLLAAAPIGCARAPEVPRAPRLVLLFAPCTVSTAFLGPYRTGVDFTPNLDRFAAQAVVFEEHWTEAPDSGVAYASLLTGTQADRHGVYRHPLRLADELVLLPEVFAEGGFQTFYWSQHGMATAELGYAQGVPARHVFERPLEGGDPGLGLLLERLRREPEARAFVMANSVASHGPYNPRFLRRFLDGHREWIAGMSAEAVSRYVRLYREHHMLLSWNLPRAMVELGLGEQELGELARVVEALYAANVARVDALFGGIVGAIERAGLLEESVVVFTADHGELLYREGAPFQWSHSNQLAPEALRVPFLIHAPGLAPGRYRGITRSVDVFPTLLGLSGLPPPEGSAVAGVDLSAALRGRAAPPRLEAFAHTSLLAEAIVDQLATPEGRELWSAVTRLFPGVDVDLVWVALRRDDRRYVMRREGDAWQVRAFAADADPEREVDLFDPSDPGDAAAAEALRRYKARLAAGWKPDAEALRRLGRSQEDERLRSLGYIR